MHLSSMQNPDWIEFWFVIAAVAFLIFVCVAAIFQIYRAFKYGKISWINLPNPRNPRPDDFKIYTINKDDPENENGLLFRLSVTAKIIYVLISMAGIIGLIINNIFPVVRKIL